MGYDSEDEEPTATTANKKNDQDTDTPNAKTDILMVGCGTSRLPEAFDPSMNQLTLLDAAPTCIEALQRRYGQYNHTNHRYIVGDALRMDRNNTGLYDCVVDKGLMDALLCGEGWDAWVAQLLDSVANVLVPYGRYVLISYRLPTSTIAFLERTSAGKLAWDFVVDGSNPRVMISIAHRLGYSVSELEEEGKDEKFEPKSTES